MSLKLSAGAGLAAALAIGCGHASGAQQPATRLTPSAPAPPSALSCPRVERATRMFTGFADDASDVDLALALDVIVPIQERLGMVFCAPERSPCRPTELVRIELADSVPSAAQLRLGWKRGTLHRELTLRLLWSADGWQADTDSLSAYLGSCRAAVSEAASLTR